MTVCLVECIYADKREETGFGYWSEIMVYLPDFDSYVMSFEQYMFVQDLELYFHPTDSPGYSYNITELGEF